jgi:DNA-binding transcriptional LysR family regulator
MEKATSVTVNGRLVVTFNEVGLAAAVAGLVSMTVGAAGKEISEGLLVRALADWDMGEVELLAVFLARKAAKPSARAFVDRLLS